MADWAATRKGDEFQFIECDKTPSGYDCTLQHSEWDEDTGKMSAPRPFASGSFEEVDTSAVEANVSRVFDGRNEHVHIGPVRPGNVVIHCTSKWFDRDRLVCEMATLPRSP
jgi:hypothetical protein